MQNAVPGRAGLWALGGRAGLFFVSHCTWMPQTVPDKNTHLVNICGTNEWKETKRKPGQVTQTELMQAGQAGLGLAGVRVLRITTGLRANGPLG